VATYPFSSMPTVVSKMSEAMSKAIDVAVVLIAQDGISAMIDATPVDTTLAVSNWQITKNGPSSQTLEPIVKGSVKGSGAQAARNVAKTRAAGKLTGYKGAKTVWITNNVPYISVLEYGDVKHRPSGMVSKGLQAMAVRASSIQIIKP
jgi:hypothetical protein